MIDDGDLDVHCINFLKNLDPVGTPTFGNDQAKWQWLSTSILRYLCQGGYVYASVSLFVCLFVCYQYY